MRIPERKFVLKDGREAVLRCAEETDAEAMLEYLYVTAGETEFIIRYPEECGKYTAEGEAKWIRGCNGDPRGVMLVCTVDGKLAGNCEINFSKAIKTRHRGTIGIALIKEFWGLGIGTEMFRAMTEVAEADEYCEQMELDFVEGNSRARALYEKAGFRIAGIHPDAIRLKDGTYRNEYLMIRKVK